MSRGNPQGLKRDIELVDLQQLIEFCDLEHFTDICRGVVQMDFDTLFPNGGEQSQQTTWDQRHSGCSGVATRGSVWINFTSFT